MGTWRSPETLAKMAKAKRRKAKLAKSAAAGPVKAGPAGPVVVFKSVAPRTDSGSTAVTGESSETNKEDKTMSKQKIEKTTIQSSAARAAIAAAADELDRYAADPTCAALVSKLRAAIEAPVVDVGDGAKTVVSDGLSKSLSDLAKARERSDLDPAVRIRVEKAYRRLSTEYLRRESPAALEALEASTAQSRASNDAPFVGRPTPVVGDAEEIKRAAEKIRKSDPDLSDYEALERAYRQARAA